MYATAQNSPGNWLAARGLLEPHGEGHPVLLSRTGRFAELTRASRRCRGWRGPETALGQHAVLISAIPADVTRLTMLCSVGFGLAKRAKCPQRDSNPRYGLERAVTWAASRWGRCS